MPKAANLTIVVACTIMVTCASLGIQSVLGDQWWLILVCVLASALWLVRSQRSGSTAPNISFLILAGVCAGTIYGPFNRLWSLTNLVLLLTAWDLDRFARDIHRSPKGRGENQPDQVLIGAHLERLGWVVLLSWSLGAAVLYIQIPFNFGIALVLAALAVLSLRWVLRSLSP